MQLLKVIFLVLPILVISRPAATCSYQETPKTPSSPFYHEALHLNDYSFAYHQDFPATVSEEDSELGRFRILDALGDEVLAEQIELPNVIGVRPIGGWQAGETYRVRWNISYFEAYYGDIADYAVDIEGAVMTVSFADMQRAENAGEVVLDGEEDLLILSFSGAATDNPNALPAEGISWGQERVFAGPVNSCGTGGYGGELLPNCDATDLDIFFDYRFHQDDAYRTRLLTADSLPLSVEYSPDDEMVYFRTCLLNGVCTDEQELELQHIEFDDAPESQYSREYVSEDFELEPTDSLCGQCESDCSDPIEPAPIDPTPVDEGAGCQQYPGSVGVGLFAFAIGLLPKRRKSALKLQYD